LGNKKGYLLRENTAYDNVACFGSTTAHRDYKYYNIKSLQTQRTGTPVHNSSFANAGVSCFYDSEVLNSSFVHLMKFSSENPCLRKAANH